MFQWPKNAYPTVSKNKQQIAYGIFYEHNRITLDGLRFLSIKESSWCSRTEALISKFLSKAVQEQVNGSLAARSGPASLRGKYIYIYRERERERELLARVTGGSEPFLLCGITIGS